MDGNRVGRVDGVAPSEGHGYRGLRFGCRVQDKLVSLSQALDDEDSLHLRCLDQCGRGDGDVIATAWLDPTGS